MLRGAMDRVMRPYGGSMRGVFSVGFVMGLVAGLGALAFAKLHYARLLRAARSRLPWRSADAWQGDSEKPVAFTPVELRRSGKVVDGVAGMIGNTPLVRINSLSEITGCEILFLNPGGSPKDRVALQSMRTFVNEARARAQAWTPDASQPYARAFFADQFETEANFCAHYRHTGPEIWEQTVGDVDAFVSGAGTGGTLAGVAAFLKTTARAQDSAGKPYVVVADPQGSGLYNRVEYGVLYSAAEAEGTRRRHQVDSVVEGIGMNRLTRNVERGLPFVDGAERVSDDEAVRMSRWLASHDGLFLGSSSAVHCVAAVRTALKLKKTVERPVVVTILSADSGTRHLSKFQSDAVMAERGLRTDADISDILQEDRP
ncbi:cysteine synthase [Malassezia sp. CBS 17886]|nr:cysteine synthase [Malassezia sp. CBS 17886]